MTQSLAPITQSLAINVFGSERVAVLKEQLSRGWKEPMTDAELEHIAGVFQRNRLDPLAKPPLIYWIKRWDGRLNREVMTGQLAIDGLRLIAQRSREYAGQLGPQWTKDGDLWVDVWLADEHPAAARVGVMRKGFAQPIWSVATWREWAQYGKDSHGNRVLTQFWASMGANMLAKTAEGMSLKRAFPQETSDLELARADQEFAQEQAQLSQRYTEIYEHNDDVVVAGNNLVDRSTGEVLSSARVLTTPEPSAAAEPATPPTALVDKYRRNRELVARCKELHIEGLPPLLKLGQTDDVVEAANLELEARIAEHAEVDRQRLREGLL